MKDNKLHEGEAIPVETTSVNDVGKDKIPEPAVSEVEKTEAEQVNTEDVVEAAKKKYEESLKNIKDYEKTFFAGPVKEYIYKRFEEDHGFCEDFMQEHKSFERCMKYMTDKARKEAPTGANGLLVNSNDFLEWMEDYFRMDDKEQAEKEKKEREAKRKQKAAEQKKKDAQKKAKNNKKTADDNKIPSVKTSTAKEDTPKKKKTGNIEGQMDLFSMMGMQEV